MAHVGTTNGIDQPAATGSGGQAGLWMALIAGAVIVAIAVAFGTTQGTGSRPVIVAQRAPAVIVAPGAVTAPTFGPDWYARHVPAAVIGSDLRSGLVRPTHAGTVTAPHARSGLVRPTHAGDVTAPTFGPDWYARHMPAAVTTDAAAGTASANADRNRHHRPLAPGQRLHR